ncbi:hypothetical protein DFH08DRAFT_817708 [Mycena albidolilacea]|uniref:Uncharacterized protein n=1 Tax=Mycena albidolilacea TaxID=1033008 RepID=A0AAD7EIH9_9AGAR|nr:hypothetical protein DFH08DRAFT_817708 [Mycena albidolilacea]
MEVTEVLEVLNVESNHKHSGHVWLLNPWHFTNRRKTTKNQDIHTTGNVVEVLEVSNVGSNQLQASCTQKRDIHAMRVSRYTTRGVGDQPIATHKLMYMKGAAQIKFYCDRGDGGSDETGRQAHGCTQAGKQHLNLRDSRGVGGSGGVGGEKAAEMLEVDQFHIAGEADTESKQFKPEDI